MTGVAINKVQQIVLELELDGKIERQGGNRVALTGAALD